MDNKSMKLGGELLTSVRSDAVSILWRAAHQTGIEAYSSLRIDLNRAIDEYRLRHYEKAEDILENLIAYTDKAIAKVGADTTEHGYLCALKGAALSVRGRVYEHLGRREEAAAAFHYSVSMYEHVLTSRQQDSVVVPEDFRDLGIALQKVGRASEALYLLKKAIELGENSSETFCQIGNLLHSQGLFSEAAGYFEQATKLNPDNSTAHTAMGDNFRARGETEKASGSYMKAALIMARVGGWDSALELLGRCVELDCGNFRVLFIRAEVLRLAGRYDEALEALDRALEVEPDDAFALGTKGQILRVLNQNEEAVEVLGHALTLNSEMGWVYAELGEALRMLGRNDEALPAFESALEREPDNILAKEGKGALLVGRGDYQGGLEILEQLLEDEPNNAYALSYKGEALRLQGKHREALEALDRALEVEPDDAFALGTKGQILRVLNQNEEAVEVLGHALTLNSEMGWVYAELGEALRMLGRNDEALPAFESALEREPDNPLIWGSMGASLYSLRRYTEALEALDRGLEGLPHYPWALYIKSAILCESAEFADALRTLEHINEESAPEILGSALSLKGWALENLGHAGEAKEAYEASLAIQPKNYWSLKGVANSLYILGLTEEAREIYQRILEQLNDMDEPDAYFMALKGWCLYRVGQHNDAMRRFVDALSLDSTIIYPQFDLALVSMDSKRYGLGLREYGRALELLEGEHELRRRGLLYVALKDLNSAIKATPSLGDVPETKTAQEMIRSKFDEIRVAR